MLTEERKAIVDALSDEELTFEVNRGITSRFQAELFDYAKTRLQLRQQAKLDQQAADQLMVAKESGGASWWGAQGTWGAIIVTLLLALLTKYATGH